MRHLNFPKAQPPYNPEEWAGVNPRYSHLLEVPTSAPIEQRAQQAGARRWHYLDNLPVLVEQGLEPIGTILCVHGNPTWSYLWRTVLDAGVNERAPWRVVAVDQIDMGYSERTHLDLEGERRTLTDRIADLGDFTKALGLDETDKPLVTLAHDWGGLVSFGWALEHREILSGVMLTNTAVYHDGIENIPAALRLALGVHEWGTHDSTAFIDVTLGLAQNEGRLPAPGSAGAGALDGALPQPVGKQPKRLYPSPLNEAIYRTYRAPYAHSAWREGVRNFVGDIPTGADVPSYAPMQRIAEQIRGLDVPAFFQWGTKDPVFQRRYLFDLMERMPQAKVHRYEKASHLVIEDYDIASPMISWLAQTFGTREDGALVPPHNVEAEHRAARARRHGLVAGEGAVEGAEGTAADGTVPAAFRPMLAALTERADDASTAVVDMDPKGDGTSVSVTLTWAELNQQVNAAATRLHALGVRPGDRVNLMVPPGARLTTLIYACMKLGAVIVVADTGLGIPGLTRALKGANPSFLVGIPAALSAARTLLWPGVRISVEPLGSVQEKLLGVAGSVFTAPAADGTPGAPVPTPTVVEFPSPVPDADAAVLYTSGSTGPAKGVVYTQRQLAGMRDAIANTYGFAPGSGLVAGFAPFALLGPALGATSVTPTMDVTRPKTLTASALASAAAAIDASVVFASPAALVNVVATADELNAEQRAALAKVQTVLSAGAPIPVPLLEALSALVPNASLHTPYGMTEGLPVTDVSFEMIRQAIAEGTPNAAGEVLDPFARDGVCVGFAVYGAAVAIAPLLQDGSVADELTHEPGVTGEILVSAPHVKDRYDTLWVTEEQSISTPGWHHTGDVGHLDASGRLWVEGRLAHVLLTSQGVLTPVAAEQSAESLPEVRRAALVAVGPAGTAAPVLVIEASANTAALEARQSASGLKRALLDRVPGARRFPIAEGVAPFELSQLVRQKVAEDTGVELAAVLVVHEHPTDIRHNSKIDRPALGEWASKVLAGA
ncbi:MAG: alpha/beta fold hydrolase [Rothia mucilaginosa]|uniref:alpha/beta fold hydrolase n=1 Tax=Rothia mucilaginosa TaxID=43675 RepID=UPI001CB6391D|nr:alpha/beta fold hydrolase [Rothia mucilaginosa]MBF1651764.1 alpha/beta fold hydrolase [Rothia mucilaginosa]